MPKASTRGYSNHLADERVDYFGQARLLWLAAVDDRPIDDQGRKLNADGSVSKNQPNLDDDNERGEERSAGMSSSTSGSKRDKSGSSTGTAHQSHVQGAENLSGPAQPRKPASTSASSTDGSTHGTGSGRASRPASSAASAQAPEATAGRGHESPGSDEDGPSKSGGSRKL